MRTVWLIQLAFLLSFSSAVFATEPKLGILPGRNEVDARFIVRELPQSLLSATATENSWEDLLGVYTVVDGRVAPTAVLGDYTVEKEGLTFTPRYPLRRGVTYRAVLRIPNKTTGKTIELTRDLTPAAEKPTSPTREQVPENLLKFYFHFSAPMSRGEVYSRVKLRDPQGQLVEGPFLELGEELWSPDGMRLTLYFDPGRIKRGLQPRELFGPALLEGHTYTLELDPNWPDALGRPLTSAEKPIRKKLNVGAPDDQQPAIERWKVLAPAAGTRAPLTILFDEPLDSAMLVRVLQVRDAAGKIVAGEPDLGKSEESWIFRPTANWLPGKYQLETATTLEDLAGNSLGRPFEVDVFRPLPKPAESDTARLRFTIPQPAGS